MPYSNFDKTAPETPGFLFGRSTDVGEEHTYNMGVVIGQELDASIQVSMDAGLNWQTISDGWSLTEGYYQAGQVQTRQIDTAGNVSGIDVVNYDFAIDKTAPETPGFLFGSSKGAGEEHTYNMGVVIGQELDASIQVSMDAGLNWQTISDGWSLTEGYYQAGQVQTRQIDTAGNVSGIDVVNYDFAIDKTAPETPGFLFGSGKGAGEEHTYNMGVVTGQELDASIQVSMDAGLNWQTISDGWSLTEGYYQAGQVQTRQIDTAGNVSGIDVVNYDFAIDKTAPETPGFLFGSSKGAGEEHTYNMGVVIGQELDASIQVSMDAGLNWQTISDGWSLTEGYYQAGQVQTCQIDTAGNVSGIDVVNYDFAIDKTAPETPGFLFGSGKGAGEEHTYNMGVVIGQELDASIQVSMDAGLNWQTISDGWSFTEGYYQAGQVQTRQIDTAGNVSGIDVVNYDFAIDKTAPETPGFLFGSSKDTGEEHNYNTGVVTGKELGASVQVSMDAGLNWQTISDGWSLDEGHYHAGEVQTRQIDTAGNVSGVEIVNNYFTIQHSYNMSEIHASQSPSVL